MCKIKIEQIDTTVFRLPMLGELRWGKHSSLSELRHVLVQVRLSNGAVGVAEAPPRPTIYGETPESIVGIIERELAPRVIGSAVDKPAGIWARLCEIKNNHAAKGAIDIALHHALAQSQGQNLAEYLDVTKKSVKVSYILGISDRDEMLAEAERVFAAGVRVFKVKVGRNWTDDLARIYELKELFGDELSLYADANECFSLVEASTRLAALSNAGLLYCEEPLPIEYIQDRATLRAGEHLPIIADDSTFSERDLRRELALDTFDILNIKTARTGYSESTQMLSLATAAQKGVMIGSQASAGLGTARAALFAAKSGVEHPSELSFFLKLKEDIVAQPLTLMDGYLSVADALTLSVDPALLADASV